VKWVERGSTSCAMVVRRRGLNATNTQVGEATSFRWAIGKRVGGQGCRRGRGSHLPDADSGPCAVEVDTLANSCPSGSCAQPPSEFDFAGPKLSLAGGKYRGTFVVKTGCNARGEYWPYAYEQHTILAFSAASSAEVGTIGTEPIRHVSAISGSLTIREASTGTRGYSSYSERFELPGKVQR
jgi:hypothetical protein